MNPVTQPARRRTGPAARLLSASILVATLAAAGALTACNTVAGAGEDVGAVGAGVAHGANAVKNGG